MSESIDIFCHWLPKPFAEKALACAEQRLYMFERASKMPVMVDLEARFRLMDAFPGYVQVPSVASPPIEQIAGPEVTPELAQLANDEQAKMAAAHPDRFTGFVAALPMNNPEAAMAEAERAIKELGALGTQIFTNVNDRPLDEPEYLEVIEHLAGLGKPVWLHPTRGMSFADYPGEAYSKYDLWWTIGWPLETALAMSRLIYCGLFDRHPNLVMITHHAGGIVPMLEGRLRTKLGMRNPPELADAVATPLKEAPLDALKRFYTDCACSASQASIECGLQFFGVDKMLFASDLPFDAEQGATYIRAHLEIIDKLDISTEERKKILSGNAKRILEL